jgi:deoxyribodipyrimidine photo-lyase
VLEIAKNICEKIIPIFQFRDKQINDEKNKYFSHSSVRFMCECLDELYDACNKRLTYYYDDFPDPDSFDVIFIAKDYTDYAINYREKKLQSYARDNGKNLIIIHNHLLDVPLSVTPGNKGVAYTKFTPYYNAFMANYVCDGVVPSRNAVAKFVKGDKNKNYIAPKDIHQFYDESAPLDITPGRTEAKKILSALKDFRDYKKTRDYPSLSDGTTRLSAYNKFGCISAREVYLAVKEKLGLRHDLIKQMIWREFYYNIAISFPRTTQGESLKEAYDSIKWSYNKDHIRAWQTGNTGYAIVDAGMRQLNATGYMHNRLRMITASFLIKHLQIDWRVGEKYFARKLIDYDPIINNGNWQWVAGCGADAQPYFRIFNPYLQEKKFDKDQEFIKQFLSDDELKNLQPIVDHKTATAKTIKMYKAAL